MPGHAEPILDWAWQRKWLLGWTWSVDCGSGWVQLGLLVGWLDLACSWKLTVAGRMHEIIPTLEILLECCVVS